MNTREASDFSEFARGERRTSRLLWLKFMEIGHKQDCHIARPNSPSATHDATNLFVALPDVSLVSPGRLLLPCPKRVFTRHTTVFGHATTLPEPRVRLHPVIFVAIFRSPWVALYSCPFALGKRRMAGGLGSRSRRADEICRACRAQRGRSGRLHLNVLALGTNREAFSWRHP